MTDRDALYAAVLAAPDDDTPRLVYADYLDDTGARADAIRARFIRNQVALARAELWSAEYDRLLHATFPVEFEYGKRWAGSVGGVTLPVRYTRGFVEEVTCYATRFVLHGAKLFAAHPIRAVKFAVMNGTRGAASAKELAVSSHLARLHTITLNGTLIDNDFIGTLGESRHTAGIRSLTLGDCAVTTVAASRLGSAWFPGLRELELWNVVYATAGAGALAKVWNLSQLTTLRVCYGAKAAGTPIRGPGAVVLAESLHLRGLTELELRNQELRKLGAEAFAAAYAWPHLRRLGLRGNGIPASALPAFAANPHFRSLGAIDFRGNDIKAEYLGPLREACPNTVFLTDDTARPLTVALAPEDRP